MPLTYSTKRLTISAKPSCASCCAFIPEQMPRYKEKRAIGRMAIIANPMCQSTQNSPMPSISATMKSADIRVQRCPTTISILSTSL